MTKSTYGQQSFGQTAPTFANLTDRVLFDEVWQSPGLPPRERSLATIACLIALNRREQLPFHIEKGLENGLTKDTLGELISHLAFYAGWPCAATAATVLAQY
ncbi:carboxymuconolactone decarboxylase family protein [Gallaecimonas mangrovi]|uniref:carboxymuconolactone decarboxylase family protein n=1 Tax=Gallaecimonas mangrovi TaxID=2291597 RepID=UPI000E1FF46B|nr:carboxymuconolactone decarboxylase family protein [Gallaecimonas mangrovi]